VLVQVETGEALGQLAQIAAVPGVDGVFIGPADLSASMGISATRACEVQAAIKAAVAPYARRKAAAFSPQRFRCQALSRLGYQFVACNVDVRIFVQGSTPCEPR